MDVVTRLLADVAPGDILDLDEIEAEYGHDVLLRFLDEFDGQSFVLSSDNVVGCIDTCSTCDGTGQITDNRTCDLCDGLSLTVDYGDKGVLPFSD